MDDELPFELELPKTWSQPAKADPSMVGTSPGIASDHPFVLTHGLRRTDARSDSSSRQVDRGSCGHTLSFRAATGHWLLACIST